MDAAIYIYTFKEGLLSKLAHDLRLSVQRFEISARGTEISARFTPASLHIDGVMKDGKLVRTEPSDNDRRKIKDNVLSDVLRASEYGEVRFEGRAQSREPPYHVTGELTLCGVTRPLSVLLMVRGERLVGELELVPSQWGIKPFHALGGTLKVQDKVRVAVHAEFRSRADDPRASKPDWLSTGAELNPSVQLVWRPNPTRPSLIKSSLPPGS
ncbi:MAG: hypothetical protein RLZZ450_2757 [Pseudomonadota bacterium]|jgi:hypothetical protein